ncbi:MAG: hypothetical protein GY757_16885 [bacterium]|nr:hypothetical protein [bacterium]
MPVFFGYFDSSTARTNYEQSIEKWATELKAAGFESVTTRQLYPYWWAPAFFVDAV